MNVTIIKKFDMWAVTGKFIMALDRNFYSFSDISPTETEHVQKCFVTSSTYGWTFLKVNFMQQQTPSKTKIFKNSKF